MASDLVTRQIFFKKWANPSLFLFIFVHFTINSSDKYTIWIFWKSVVNVLGTRTRGSDKPTELWRHPTRRAAFTPALIISVRHKLQIIWIMFNKLIVLVLAWIWTKSQFCVENAIWHRLILTFWHRCVAPFLRRFEASRKQIFWFQILKQKFIANLVLPFLYKEKLVLKWLDMLFLDFFIFVSPLSSLPLFVFQCLDVPISVSLYLYIDHSIPIYITLFVHLSAADQGASICVVYSPII